MNKLEQAIEKWDRGMPFTLNYDQENLIIWETNWNPGMCTLNTNTMWIPNEIYWIFLNEGGYGKP